MSIKRAKLERLVEVHGPVCALCDRLVMFPYMLEGVTFGYRCTQRYVYVRIDPLVKRANRRLCRRATVDHIRPKSLGGTNAFENLRITCHDCNNERGNTPVEEKDKSKIFVRITKDMV